MQTAFASDVRDLEQPARVFIPVLVANLNGAGGSVWQTDLWATNTSDQPVLYQIAPCLESAGCNTINTLSPQSTAQPRDDSSRPTGRWLPVDLAVHIEARLHDLSRNASSAGVELPIVREADFRADEINLNAIPRDARFRLTLRVYGLDAGGDVTVEQLDANGNLISTMAVTLAPPAVPGLLSGYAQVALDTTPDTTPIRLRIRPRTSNLRIWALASITNNATSEVTLVQPYRQ
ncbi:MAG TPA: hypothetical protein VHX14_00185 [Thermoanaerobaculia bacterium]|jgi:hypothetical protein|nr:hypothetical protein [Thermoanaerobaculia bacterium]